jgi:hypothetical protein
LHFDKQHNVRSTAQEAEAVEDAAFIRGEKKSDRLRAAFELATAGDNVFFGAREMARYKKSDDGRTYLAQFDPIIREVPTLALATKYHVEQLAWRWWDWPLGLTVARNVAAKLDNGRMLRARRDERLALEPEVVVRFREPLAAVFLLAASGLEKNITNPAQLEAMLRRMLGDDLAAIGWRYLKTARETHGLSIDDLVTQENDGTWVLIDAPRLTRRHVRNDGGGIERRLCAVPHDEVEPKPGTVIDEKRARACGLKSADISNKHGRERPRVRNMIAGLEDLSHRPPQPPAPETVEPKAASRPDMDREIAKQRAAKEPE